MDNYLMENLFNDDLLKDEKILWIGQPNPKKYFTGMDIFLIPFSIMWGGFAIYWELSALMINKDHSGPGLIFPLFGLPFVLIGLYFIFGRFIFKQYKKKNTFYAVTNKRVLVLEKLFRTNLQSQFIEQISSIKKSVNSKGVGSIIFGNTPFFGTFYGITGMEFFGSRYSGGIIAFYDIDEVKNVYGIINDMRKA